MFIDSESAVLSARAGSPDLALWYVFGLFINDSTSEDDLDDTFTATKAELLREQIRAGLASCLPRVYLPIILR